MIGFLYLLLIFVAAGFIWQFARHAEQKRKAAGGAGCPEYRTPLAFDECLDALLSPCAGDEFE